MSRPAKSSLAKKVICAATSLARIVDAARTEALSYSFPPETGDGEFEGAPAIPAVPAPPEQALTTTVERTRSASLNAISEK